MVLYGVVTLTELIVTDNSDSTEEDGNHDIIKENGTSGGLRATWTATL